MSHPHPTLLRRLLLALLLTIGTAQIATAQSKKVLIETNMGNMTIVLYDDTPRHRDRFLQLVREGYYDQTLFGRVIPSFMIQGGAPDSRTAPPGASIGWGDINMEMPAEIRANHIPKKGALCSPRRDTSVNPKRNSDMSMFFIVQGRTLPMEYMKAFEKQHNEAVRKAVKKKMYTPEVAQELANLKASDVTAYNARVRKFNHEMDSVCRATPGTRYFTPAELEAYSTVGGSMHLYNDYTIFGEVISGLDVIDKIAELETDTRDRPKTDVRMTIKVIE
jgi:cyclophilin family peptidyl-prolyl cis-trans isomerase